MKRRKIAYRFKKRKIKYHERMRKMIFRFSDWYLKNVSEFSVCEWKAPRTIITSWKCRMEKKIHSFIRNLTTKNPSFYRGSFLSFILHQQLSSSSWWNRSKCVYPCTLYRYVPKICRMFFTNNEIIKRQWHNAIIHKKLLPFYFFFLFSFAHSSSTKKILFKTTIFHHPFDISLYCG